ncbi:putative endonuclease [uncultured Mediterranean phage uvDeep-CGR2-KM21-C368]|nr:putative endonuclease [uncultured Mediterranean phage uvDeep-CGR2-KM21-C368]
MTQKMSNEERRKGIGSSDANTIMRGDWLDLIKIKKGEMNPPTLEDIFKVQLGTYTESFNIKWLQKIWKKKYKDSFIEAADPNSYIEKQLPIGKDKLTLYANPDGWLLRNGTKKHFTGVVECKHTYSGNTWDNIIESYYPQIHHQMFVTDSPECVLSIICGNDFRFKIIKYDPNYAEELIAMEKEFWYNIIGGKNGVNQNKNT